MNAKEYLGQAYRLDQHINSKLQQVEHLRELTNRVTASYACEPVSRTRNVSSMEDTIIRLMEAEEDLNRQIDELVTLKMEMSELIGQVRNESYRLILEMRYLALPTFSFNQLEITALSFDPKVIAVGEETEITISLKNKTGAKITKCSIMLGQKYESSVPLVGNYYETAYDIAVNLHGTPETEATIDWANNAVKTFTARFHFHLVDGYPLNSNIGYMLPVSSETGFFSSGTLSLSIHGATSSTSIFAEDHVVELCGQSREYLAILSERDDVWIDFDVERTDDEATSVMTSIKLHGNADAFSRASPKYTAALSYLSESNSWVSIAFNRTVAQLISGITNDAGAVSATFANTRDWQFKLRISNGYQSFTAIDDISEAFANVHLSGLSTGGVRFGGFCTKSAPNRPVFECDYPIYADGGIEGITNYCHREIKTGGKWVDGRPIYRRVFYRLEGGQADLWQDGSAYLSSVIDDVDAIVNVSGYFRDNTSPYTRVIPWTWHNGNGSYNAVDVAYDNTVSKFKLWSMGVVVTSFVVAVEYTKSSDTPVPVYYAVPVLTSNNDKQCVVSASTEYNSSYPAWYAFSGIGNNNNYWASTNSDTNRWIQISMPHKLKNMFVTLCNTPTAAGNVGGGSFLGSNNGTTWTTMETFTRTTEAWITTEHDLRNSVAYKYLRIAVASYTSGHWSGILHIMIDGEIA